MSVDQATVRRVAKLARLKVTEAQLPQLEAELNGILGWIEQLNEVDVTGVAPLTSVVSVKMKMRKDVVTDGRKPKDVTVNAPATEDDYFLVPKVIE